MKNVKVVWFEIPVVDMDRAKTFYEQVFDTQIAVHDMNGTLMGWFPGQDNNIGAAGSLMLYKDYTPSHDGTLVYLSCDDVGVELGRVNDAGGKVMMEKTMISPEHGFMGLFEDCEGNRIAVHSVQ